MRLHLVGEPESYFRSGSVQSIEKSALWDALGVALIIHAYMHPRRGLRVSNHARASARIAAPALIRLSEAKTIAASTPN